MQVQGWYACLIGLVAACGSSPAKPGEPTEPVEVSQPATTEKPKAEEPSKPDVDELGSIRPLPYREVQLVHVDPDAEKLHAAGDFAGCGKAYVDRYNRNPSDPEAPRVLLTGASCFLEGRLVGAAIRLFDMLDKRHPQSPLSADALLGKANAYASIAYYDRAAEAYELYARKFAGHDQAPRALMTAIRYRLGTGDEKRALQNGELFARSYGRSLPAQAAAAHMLAATVHERRGDRPNLIRHLESFLKRFGKRAPLEQQIAAHVKLGKALWRHSCPVEPIERGVCATLQRVADPPRRKGAVPLRCHPPREALWKLVPRNRKLAERAAQELKRALALAARATSIEASYWAAAAQFYLGERELESFLSIEMPDGLQFDNSDPAARKRDMARFQQFIERMKTEGDRAQKAYVEVTRQGEGALYWSVAVWARLAQSRLRFADLVGAAPVPDKVRTGKYAQDTFDLYCQALDDNAVNPLTQRAVAILERCVKLASTAGWYDDWTRWCQSELARHKPRLVPSLDELYAAPTLAGVAATTADRRTLERAIQADPKAVPPRLELAALLLEELGAAAASGARARLQEAIRMQLSSALAVEPDNDVAYVLLASLYLQDAEVNESRELLAQLLLEEAARRNPKSAALLNARGIVKARRGRLGSAYLDFQDAIAADPKLVAGQLNAGAAALRLLKLERASDYYAAALAADPSSYDGHIGLGVALRAQGHAAAAEKQYREAAALDPSRPEADVNLGILHSRAHDPAADLKAAMAVQQKAAGYFKAALAKPGLTGDRRRRVERELARTEQVIKLLGEAAATAP